MNDLQYLREESRRLSDACHKNSSAMIKFITAGWTGISAFISWAYEEYQNWELISIVLPMVLFISSVYIFLSAQQQIKYRFDLSQIQTYIYCFHRESKWERLNFRNRINEEHRKDLQWVDGEYSVFSILSLIFTVVCVVIGIKTTIPNFEISSFSCWCDNAVYILFAIFIIATQIRMFIVTYSKTCRKQVEKMRQMQIREWYKLGKKKSYLSILKSKQKTSIHKK